MYYSHAFWPALAELNELNGGIAHRRLQCLACKPSTKGSTDAKRFVNIDSAQDALIGEQRRKCCMREIQRTQFGSINTWTLHVSDPLRDAQTNIALCDLTATTQLPRSILPARAHPATSNQGA